MSAPPPPIEDLSVEQLRELARQQARVIAELAARVADLERRLGLNSRNSSKPPSSDGLAKPPPRSLRKGSGRRPGKQPGSASATLSLVDDPDEVREHRPAACSGCGGDLAGAVLGSVTRRQVFDLAPVRAQVMEHRLVSCLCTGCGVVSAPQAPPGVAAPVQYGPGITAVVVYLLVRQHLPVARVAETCADLLGMSVSTGWIATRLAPAAAAVTGFDQRVRDAVRAAAVAHFDESGARVAGRTHWVHSASTPALTVYDLHDKRGRLAMQAAGILPGYAGIAVHDCWQPYFSYVDVTHAVCNAHILRELTGWHDTDPHRHAWAEQAIDVLTEANAAVVAAKASGHTALPAAVLADFDQRWQAALAAGYTANPRPAAGRGDRVVALLDRLHTATTEIWRFSRNFAVPFDNNQAERDIRMVKLQLKISGCWRTETGSRQWLLIRSYISTVIKNGLNVLEALRDALTGNPWLPPLPATT
jgi:transposase